MKSGPARRNFRKIRPMSKGVGGFRQDGITIALTDDMAERREFLDLLQGYALYRGFIWWGLL